MSCNVLEILLSQTRFNEYLDNRTRLSLRSVSNGTYELTPILDTVTNVGALDCPTIRHLRKLRTRNSRIDVNYEEKFPKLRDLRIEDDDFVTSIVLPELKTLIYENIKGSSVLERISCPRLRTLRLICAKDIFVEVESNKELTDLRLVRVNLKDDLKEFPNLRNLELHHPLTTFEITNPLLENINYVACAFSPLKRVSCAGKRLRSLTVRNVDEWFQLEHAYHSLEELNMSNVPKLFTSISDLVNLKILRLNSSNLIGDRRKIEEITNPLLEEIWYDGPYELLNGESPLKRISCAGGRLRSLTLRVYNVNPTGFLLEHAANSLIELNLSYARGFDIDLSLMPNLEILRLSYANCIDPTTIEHPNLRELCVMNVHLDPLRRIRCPKLQSLKIVASGVSAISEFHCPELKTFMSSGLLIFFDSPSFPQLETLSYPSISILRAIDADVVEEGDFFPNGQFQLPDDFESRYEILDVEDFDVERIKFVNPKIGHNISNVIRKFKPTSLHVDFRMNGIEDDIVGGDLIENLYLRSPSATNIKSFAASFPNVRSLTVYDYPDRDRNLDVSDFRNLLSLVITRLNNPLDMYHPINFIGELKYNSTLEKLVTVRIRVEREDGGRLKTREHYEDRVPDEYRDTFTMLFKEDVHSYF